MLLWAHLCCDTQKKHQGRKKTVKYQGKIENLESHTNLLVVCSTHCCIMLVLCSLPLGCHRVIAFIFHPFALLCLFLIGCIDSQREQLSYKHGDTFLCTPPFVSSSFASAGCCLLQVEEPGVIWQWVTEASSTNSGNSTNSLRTLWRKVSKHRLLLVYCKLTVNRLETTMSV